MMHTLILGIWEEFFLDVGFYHSDWKHTVWISELDLLPECSDYGIVHGYWLTLIKISKLEPQLPSLETSPV
jgi:hypothetical protein